MVDQVGFARRVAMPGIEHRRWRDLEAYLIQINALRDIVIHDPRMTDDLIKRYGGPVPRYTSYPTAPHFHAGVTADCYSEWLREIPAGTPTSLYFHVPFCDQLCWYCGCHTQAVRRYGPIGAYAKNLIKELDWVAERFGERPPVTHIHFGGGTPTLLRAEDFQALIDHVRARFNVTGDAEIAIEVDPRTLSRSMVATLSATGVNRASLGVQDFTPRVQHAINRVQSFETVETAVQCLRAAGIQAINFDLMYGLPGQTVEDVINTVDLSARLGPDRFSVFGYAHVPWMKSHQKLIDEDALPGASARLEQAGAAARRLIELGYRQVGLDHFAAPHDSLIAALDDGALHRNFQGYTTDRAEVLLGIGASAIGHLPRGYVQNAASTRAYMNAIGAGRAATASGIAVDAEDRARGRIIERLMCGGKVDLAGVVTGEDCTNAPFQAEMIKLREMHKDGLLEIEGDVIRVTDAGAPFVRAVAAVFDPYLSHGRGRHSSAV
jgi:oxygen-independent coproporphyrinogen III oxidase